MLIKGSTFWSIDDRDRVNSQRRVPYPHLPSAKSHRNECPVALLFALKGHAYCRRHKKYIANYPRI